MLQHKFQAFYLIELQTLLAWVENIELWWIMGKQKILGWKSTFRLDKIDSLTSIG